MKEPTGNKGPRLTGNITMPGRYVVLMPYGKGVNLSRRISDENERSRLRALAVLIKPPGMGMLVRTEAEGTDEESIIEDLENLQKQWEAIQQQANYGRPPMLINRDDDFIQRVLRDMYSDEVNRIVVDSASGVKRVKSQLMNWEGGKTPDGLLIDHHREKQHILEYFRVNAAIREAIKPRVDLPSGGYIIIEPTEALTVIDVNSGSFTRSATARETVVWTNFEAATEIARQLRLRNIGGVIVVDFIDMDARRDQLKLLEHFTRVLKADKSRPQIAQLSELGLVELTRKRQGQNLYELFGVPCPHCSGLGHLAHLPGEEEPVSLQLNTLSLAPVSAPVTVDSRPTIVNRVAPVVNGRVAKVVSAAPVTGDPLDLLNHPDYQEQGNAGNRRRRRRAPEVSAKPVLKDLNDGVGVKDNGDRPIILKEENPDAPAAETAASTGGNAPSRYDRRERGRYRREEIKYETVQVEMTPEEQSVYALIGVSPLVKVEGGDKKDLRSTIVRVLSPGEMRIKIDEAPEAEIPAAPQPVVVETVEPIAEPSEPVENKRRIIRKPTVQDISNLVVETAPPTAAPTLKPTITPVETSAPEAIEVEQNDPEIPQAIESDQKIVRRRRRRSSATDE
jgi:ribonuclease E